MGKAIGIDFGTTKCCVALMEGKMPRVIDNAEGARTTPCIVAFTDNGRVVGEAAKRQAITNPERTVFAVKRLIGRRYDDVAVQSGKTLLPYTLKQTSNGAITIQIETASYSPSQISAFVLQKLKETAEAYLGTEVEFAVIAVPAYFDEIQRQCIRDAARIAGLEVLRIINASTAAAVGYGCADKNRFGTIAVYDLGGGTFEFSILQIGDGVFDVMATNGHTFLGGEDFDMRLVNYLADEFQKEQGIDLRRDKVALQRLKEAAEKAKIELSSTMRTEINLPFITADAAGPKHLTMKLTRTRFEELVYDLIQNTVEPCKQALKDAAHQRSMPAFSVSDIDEIALVWLLAEQLLDDFLHPRHARHAADQDASIPTRSWRSVLRFRRASCKATSRTCC